MYNYISAIKLFFASSLIFSSAAGASESIRWWAEKNDREYYYIDTKGTEDAISDFLTLRTKYGWEQDITGHTTSNGKYPVIQARLYRPHDYEKPADDWKPFSYNRRWFNRIISSSPYSVEMEWGSEDLFQLHTEMKRKGYKQGFEQMGTTNNKSYITFYK